VAAVREGMAQPEVAALPVSLSSVEALHVRRQRELKPTASRSVSIYAAASYGALAGRSSPGNIAEHYRAVAPRARAGVRHLTPCAERHEAGRLSRKKRLSSGSKDIEARAAWRQKSHHA